MKGIDVIILGPAKTGKTTIMKQYFSDDYYRVSKSYQDVGARCFKKEHTLTNGVTCRLKVWDPCTSMVSI
eukprot:CAMPEP_0116883236 /NCGR_PEP_ID=MMETSP0463-20121206/15718_1 /TAXON_ID=181622 /ORGANISM="Strombidinopsis sp, Strain SopsisLIS2011" /LENGTH=69 /DNA_ID=CAMNT_0004537719 /DNA_START=71 /DNA_END=280 /DNA_ORIENTATION=+